MEADDWVRDPVALQTILDLRALQIGDWVWFEADDMLKPKPPTHIASKEILNYIYHYYEKFPHGDANTRWRFVAWRRPLTPQQQEE